MSSRIKYTDHALLTGTKIVELPGRSSGYGGKVPTRYMIQYDRKWRRVYAMVYGNGGVPYVIVNGVDLVLDIKTEDHLSKVSGNV